MNKFFFELLQVALGTRSELSRVISAEEWDELFEQAERQAIVGVLLGGLERLPAVQLPPVPLKLQWIGIAQMMGAEYKLHCERAKELTRRFRVVGFKSCVLKGVGMAQYYSVPEWRQCGDIDLWVDGRRKDVMAWLRSQYKIGLVTWHHTDAEIFEDVPTEIHVHPAWMYRPLKNRRLQMFFDRNKDVQMVEDKKLGFAHTTARFDAVYSLVHSFHHLMDEGVGLRHIVDYFFVLKRLKEETPHQDRDDDETLRVIRSIGLGKYARAMMWVLKEACGMPSEILLCCPDEPAGRFLLHEIMQAGNFGHYDARMVIPENETYFHWIKRKFVRQLRFFKYYPGEVFWTPIWKTWHKGWRAFHN